LSRFEPGALTSARAAGGVLLTVCLVLTAFNLRPVFSSLSAVLPEVLAGTGSSPLVGSLLTTLPVLCLGVFAPAAPPLARRFGMERVILAMLVAVAAGTLLRGVPALPAIAAGSLLAGAGIAVMNVILPGLVKRDFPDRTARVTGLYSMSLCAGAALAAALTVPLAGALGSWSAALAAWGLPAVAAALTWLALPGKPREPARPALAGPPLWRDPLAWQVTAFMGSQSALAYCVFGWLAPLLRERGLDPALAGYVVSVSVFSQMAASLFSASLATLGRDQRPASLLLAGLATGGLLGMMFAPLPAIWVFAVLQGVGQGGLFSVAMIIIILRSPDPMVAARLSGMAQGLGYLLAACGPLAIGVIRDQAGHFGPTAILFGGIGLAIGAAALGAGRARLVRAR
jgi:CP family cyanate transporter-like MFS transporter